MPPLFFPVHDDYLDTGYLDSTSTMASLTRLPQQRLHHPTLSATSTSAQRAIALLDKPRRFSLQPRLSRCVDRYDRGGCPSSYIRIFLQSHRLHRYCCDCGGMSSIVIIRRVRIASDIILPCLVLQNDHVHIYIHPRGSSNTTNNSTKSPFSPF